MKIFLPIITTLVLLVLACNAPTLRFATTPTSTSKPLIQPSTTLKPPDSDAPAAGICAPFDGEIVTVTINEPPPPDPRCAQVTAHQRLRVINHGDSPVHVALARFDVTLQPGEETLFDLPFDEYLAPGVHSMLNGAEIWLADSIPSP